MGRARRRSANGAAALRETACWVWRMRRAAATRAITRPSKSSGFWRRWTSRRRRVMPLGRTLCWRRHLGDISKHQIWRVLRRHEISLARRRSWCISTDPALPRRRPISSGSTCSRRRTRWCWRWTKSPTSKPWSAQGWLKLPNGKPLTGFSHAISGTAPHPVRRPGRGHWSGQGRPLPAPPAGRISAFYEPPGRPYPDRELHVILDNLNTHKPRHDRWLARHLNVHFHFTPTHASWLNQVEIWFSILSSKALAVTSFTSP